MTPDRTGITYLFHFSGAIRKRIVLEFARDRFTLIEDDTIKSPAWADLGFHHCDHCPLAPVTGVYCPFARALAPLIPLFETFYSYEHTVVEVTTERRTIVGRGALQEGTASLIGLIGATSGCPHLAFFRPMARFHLPFASEEETLFRVFSTHLLGCHVHDRPATLDGLRDRFTAAARVNAGMADRLRAGLSKDALVNGLIILDTFTAAATYVMDRRLEELRHIFST